MSLLEFQRRMFEDVCRPLTAEFTMQRSTEEGYPVADLASTYIKPNGQLSSFERLEIYNRQYWLRASAAVAEDYSALKAVLGAKTFDSLVVAYLKETPSTSWTLRDLSGKLPAFLQFHPEFAINKHRLAVDVARLEWAYIEAFDGAQFAPLAEGDIQSIGPGFRARLQPHVQLLQLDYPVDEFVLAVHKSQPEADIVSGAASPRTLEQQYVLPAIRSRKIYLAVHRWKASVYYRRIKRETLLLLLSLREGLTISQAIAHAFANTRLKEQQQAMLLRESFAHASELGWLCPRD